MIEFPSDHTIDDIAPETHLYRFVDIYGFFDFVQNRRLRLSRVDRFEDVNEAIGLLLWQMYFKLGPCGSAVRGHWSTKEEAREYHINQQKLLYMTCWSRDSDSISLWTQYSIDRSAIRIATTVAKLRMCVNRYMLSFFLEHLDNESLDEHLILPAEGSLERVIYIDIEKTINDIKWRAEAEKRVKRIWPESHLTTRPKDRETIFDRTKERNFWKFKDKAYSYENEVRAVIRLGSLFDPKQYRDLYIKLLDEWKKSPDLQYLPLTVTDPDDFSLLQTNLYLPVDSDFVSDICLDPRMPEYKRRYIEEIAGSIDIPVVKSKAFGYLVEDQDYFELPEK